MLRVRLLFVALSLAGLACLCLAPASQASISVNHNAAIQSYVDKYGAAVCADLTADPTFGGVDRAQAHLSMASQASQFDAGAIVGTSVVELCPQHYTLVYQYGGGQ